MRTAMIDQRKKCLSFRDGDRFVRRSGFLLCCSALLLAVREGARGYEIPLRGEVPTIYSNRNSLTWGAVRLSDTA